MSKERQHGPAVHAYVRARSLREPAGMAALVEATGELPEANMATSAVQGQFLGFLARSMGAKRVIEVGVFTGVGTLWLADAVGPGGLVLGCDVSERYTAIGRRHWERAGVADRIELRIGPAAETLEAMTRDARQRGAWDLCYLDADKLGYDRYYELSLELLRPGGVVAMDNMLQGDRVADPTVDQPAVNAIRALNEKLHADGRVDVSFLPLGDGLYLARKR